MASTTNIPSAPGASPSVGARRKNVRLPTLPASAFASPPGSARDDRFPLPPSPSTVRPAALVDAGVVQGVETWKTQIGAELVGKTQGVVVMLDAADEGAIKLAEQHPLVLAISVPLDLSSGPPEDNALPSFLANPPANKVIALRTEFTAFSPALADGIYWAVSRGHTVDVHVALDLSEGGWESLNELVSSVMNPERPSSTSGKTGAIVLSNVLPAPLSLETSLVKLLSDPAYTNFQSYISTVSLESNVFLKYSPPSWGAVPKPGTEASDEWKKRVKMYLGQGVEAFGDQRIVFASAPSSSGAADSGDWYALARESLAELGLDQEAVDSVFAKNAQRVYSV